MYIIVSLSFALLGILYGVIIEKKVYNPLTVFLELWAVICFLPGLRLFGMYDFDESVYIIVVVGVFGFAVGYLFLKNKRIKFKLYNRSFADSSQKELRERFYRICILFLFLFYLSVAIRVTLNITSGGYTYAQMRTTYIRGTDAEKQALIYGSGLFQTLDYFIFRPMFYCAIAVTIARFFKSLRPDLQTVLMVGTVACYVATNFGRVILFEIIASMAVCACITGLRLTRKQKTRLKKIIIRYVIPTIILMVIVMSVISSSRKEEYSEATSLLEELYAYFAVPLPLLSHWSQQIQASGDMTWGLMFVKGIVSYIMIFLGKLGISSSMVNNATEIVNNTETFIMLFPGYSYNAFVTMFYHFYVDFRMVGVFLGSFIYGGIFSRAFARVVNKFKNVSIYELAVFLLLFQSLMKCFVRWEFVQTTYCVSYIWLILWFRRPSKKATKRLQRANKKEVNQ